MRATEPKFSSTHGKPTSDSPSSDEVSAPLQALGKREAILQRSAAVIEDAFLAANPDIAALVAAELARDNRPLARQPETKALRPSVVSSLTASVSRGREMGARLRGQTAFDQVLGCAAVAGPTLLACSICGNTLARSLAILADGSLLGGTLCGLSAALVGLQFVFLSVGFLVGLRKGH
jgi:hypothetical protein